MGISPKGRWQRKISFHGWDLCYSCALDALQGRGTSRLLFFCSFAAFQWFLEDSHCGFISFHYHQVNNPMALSARRCQFFELLLSASGTAGPGVIYQQGKELLEIPQMLGLVILYLRWPFDFKQGASRSETFPTSVFQLCPQLLAKFIYFLLVLSPSQAPSCKHLEAHAGFNNDSSY